MVESQREKTILITGSTGYVGSQIVNHVLNERRFKEYTIRCTVRDLNNKDKISALEKFFGNNIRLSFVEFDLMDRDSIDKAVDGCEYVIHCAQPVTSDNSDRDKIIQPAVEGTKSVMAAAQKFGVKRVVYTGSISAMYDFKKTPELINESHWSDLDSKAISAYNLSKVLAEQAAWDFLK